MNQQVATLLTMPEIAALAQVQRPVVTMWSARYRGDDRPFPSPVQVRGRQKHFNGEEIVRWLQTRTLGNCTSLDEDLALYSVLNHGADLTEETVFDGVSALLCLKWHLGDQLSDFSVADLLDEADELDPDDAFLYAELESLGDRLGAFAEHVDRMVDAAYGPKHAFEALVARRLRLIRTDLADSAISPAGLALCAAIAASITDPGRHIFIDPAVGSSDLLVAIRAALPEYTEPTSIRNEAGSPNSRLARRRLTVHGWARQKPPADEFRQGFAMPGPTAFVVQYPSPSTLTYTDTQILSEVDDIAVQMSDDHVAVILAPASALLDAQPDPVAARTRSDILRSDRVRAAVRLPEGLLTAKPGTAMALWVLGPAPATIKPADRLSVVIDVGSRELDADTTDGLVSDIVAAMGDWSSIRAHAFQFGVLIETSVLLAEDKRGLVPSRIKQVRSRRRGSELAAKILAQSDIVRRTQLQLNPDFRVPVEYRDSGSSHLPTLGQLVDTGMAKVQAGNRIDAADIVDGGAVRVIGTAEVMGDRPLGHRGIDRLLFTTAYPNSRYTEPGDIIFHSGARFGAIVDHGGASVVVYPARIIRIADVLSSGLIPDVIVGYLNASALDSRPPGAIRSSTTWKRWEVPRVPPGRAATTIDTMTTLRERRNAAMHLVAEIDQLTNTLVDGLAHGVLAVVNETQLPPERATQDAS